MPILFLAAVAGLAYLGYAIVQQNLDAAAATPETQTAPGAPVVVDPGLTMNMQINPMDRSTWPTGDRIWQFCQAIAAAEGYGADLQNVPTAYHNPGDLGPADTGYPGVWHSGSTVSRMPDDITGWMSLYRKVARIFGGSSSTYTPQMTILEMAQKYAGDWRNWSRNVANDLAVNESTKLGDWYNA